MVVILILKTFSIVRLCQECLMNKKCAVSFHYKLILNSNLAIIVRLVTSVTNPLYLPNIPNFPSIVLNFFLI
jgi:hypothetical protein